VGDYPFISGGIYSKFANRLCRKGVQWGGAYVSAMHIQFIGADDGMEVFSRWFPGQGTDNRGTGRCFIPAKILTDQYIYYKYHPKRYYGNSRSGKSRQDQTVAQVAPAGHDHLRPGLWDED